MKSSSVELRARRKALNFTQKQMAAWLGVSTNTVARWERMEVTCPHWVGCLLAREAEHAKQIQKLKSKYDDLYLRYGMINLRRCLDGDEVTKEEKKSANESLKVIKRSMRTMAKDNRHVRNGIKKRGGLSEEHERFLKAMERPKREKRIGESIKRLYTAM